MESNTNDNPVTIAVIGAGQRGQTYAEYALLYPKKCKVVAVAEPRPNARKTMVAAHSISSNMIFHTWQDFVSASANSISQNKNGRLADAVLVTVQDQMHSPVVTALAEQGYHILCEKPMATSPEECIRMTDAVKRSGKIFGIGHVLRYSPYNETIAKIIKSRELGDIVNIVHVEPVGYFHFAHSYVRGDWSNEKESSFSLMTKSCHDIDILCSYFSHSGAIPTRVSSFGSLSHFKRSNKPAAAGNASKCLECAVKDSCAYSAKKIYLDPVARGANGWPASTLVDGIPDIENITEALEKGRYGQCVYESPNDVVDQQVVNLEFSSGQTCSFTLVAFSSLRQRQTTIYCTHGELEGDMEKLTSTNFNLVDVESAVAAYNAPLAERANMKQKAAIKNHQTGVKSLHGHGGGDMGLISAFIRAVKGGKQDILNVTPDDILMSHMTVFAAEKSRLEGRVVNVKDFELEVRRSMAETGASNTA